MGLVILEAAVVSKMLSDCEFLPSYQPLDPLLLVITERNLSEVGFVTSFARIAEARLFCDDTSMRWGKVVGRLNSKIDVDFVVYVEDGYLTGVEGCTFGGEIWPSEVKTFDLTDLPAEEVLGNSQVI